ncbi:MAG: hypothetical protein ABI488_16515 [Polyangiaceae bacterium]
MSELLDWPQGTPLDVDPVLIELDQRPSSFLITAATSFALAGFALSPPGKRWFGVEPLPLLTFTLLHAALYAHGVWVLGPGAQSGPRWKRRALGLFVTAALAAAYGACSSSVASPAYAMLLAGAMVFGRTAPGSVLVAAALVAIPGAERVVFIRSASVESLGVATAAGAAAALMYWAVSVRSARLLRLLTQVASTSALTDLAASRQAQLKVSMSLHDGLSGALFAARRRATNAANTDQVVQIGRSLLLRAYEAIRIGHGGATPGLESELQGVAAALGVRGSITVHGSPAALPHDELDDVRDIALEAIANAARHEVAELQLRVAVGGTGVSIDCQTLGASNTEPGTGRGFRNILLRAKSRGGDAKWGGNAAQFGSSVHWPAGEVFRALPPARLALEIGAAAVFAVALGLINHSLEALLAPAVALAFGLYVCLQAAQRLECAQSELSTVRTQRRAAEQTSVLHAVDSFLAPPLSRLEQAATAANVSRIRAALADLAHALGDVMWALEWHPEPALESEPPNLLSLLAERKAERGRTCSRSGCSPASPP